MNLHFSRRLNGADGAFDGVVIVAVGAGYFVSGYETAKLGEHGVLGIIGTDGIVRVRRTGESELSGDMIPYASVIPGPDAVDTDVTVSTSSWDGVRRWTSARELYGFPLGVFAGLSAEEQLATVHRETLSFLWRALFGSILVIVLTALLGRMSWQLAQSRVREGDTKLAHAQRVEYLAYHDGLTGLPNRSMFSKLLSQRISEAHRFERRLTVAFLDLDRFNRPIRALRGI
jgi:hypothetical protein